MVQLRGAEVAQVYCINLPSVYRAAPTAGGRVFMTGVSGVTEAFAQY